jgi:hypothetical protein
VELLGNQRDFENVRQAFITPKNRISDINNAIPAIMLLRVMESLYSKYIKASILKDDTLWMFLRRNYLTGACGDAVG